MNRTLANKTLPCIAIALACASVPVAAAASTGGASAPTGRQASAPTGKQAAGGGNAAKGTDATKTSSSHGTQIATWFGPGFYGQKTACGQTMTPTIVGVASRTLPCGTLVLVAYKGHRLTVPVIDRGPYAHNGATWDLTWGAASALSIEDTVRIRTKIVGSAPNTPLLGVPAEAQPTAVAAVSGGTSAG
jgi:rare lipoprotein A (peptidoglycan hydrolase)